MRGMAFDEERCPLHVVEVALGAVSFNGGGLAREEEKGSWLVGESDGVSLAGTEFEEGETDHLGDGAGLLDGVEQDVEMRLRVQAVEDVGDGEKEFREDDLAGDLVLGRDGDGRHLESSVGSQFLR